MKSLGISVILAQAGCFVPADSFDFVPFHKLFTRITGNDNLYKNQSTFVLEMSELRHILHKADTHTLVIGDELCSGTETVSAISIVSAGIQFLSSKNTCFIFATHLHEIIPHIPKSVKIFHLTIRRENDSIIYDRILKPGFGDTLYGLEVCSSLDMDIDFIHMAYTIRNKCYGIESPFNVSKYNQKLLKNYCSICKNANNIEVHHILEQKYADKNGFLQNFHKNDLHNLVPLCKSCHDAVHKNEIIINGYVSTTKGIKLDWLNGPEPRVE
jgi:DNA mismatch repair protein MutS